MLSRPTASLVPQDVESNTNSPKVPRKEEGTKKSSHPLEVATVASLTLCWYIASSRNTVSTKQLIQSFHQHSESENPHAFNFAIMTFFTTLQLLVGLFVASLLSWIMSQRSSDFRPKTSITLVADNSGSPRFPTSKKLQSNNLIIGLLHFFGTLSTNLGYSYGSASFVQVLKLLEPVETLILTLFANFWCFKIKSDDSIHQGPQTQQIAPLKAVSVIVIVAGTSMLLLSDEMEDKVNYQTVVTSILSGLSMSSRNVAQKTMKLQQQQDANKNASRNVHENLSQPAILIGLDNFIQITSHAVVISMVHLPFLIISIALRGKHTELGDVLKWFLTSGWVHVQGKEAIILHGLYSIGSISVLSLITAQSHSLLNVGNRIVNVIVAAIFFHQPLGVKGGIGLCVAAVGGILYCKEDSLVVRSSMLKVDLKGISRVTSKSFRFIRKRIVYICLFCATVAGLFSLMYGFVYISDDVEIQRSITLLLTTATAKD